MNLKRSGWGFGVKPRVPAAPGAGGGAWDRPQRGPVTPGSRTLASRAVGQRCPVWGLREGPARRRADEGACSELAQEPREERGEEGARRSQRGGPDCGPDRALCSRTPTGQQRQTEATRAEAGPAGMGGGEPTRWPSFTFISGAP